MPTYPIHKSKFFDVREFVDEKTWNTFGVKAAWQVDPKIIKVANLLRKLTGSALTVNDWSWGGNYDSSGYRSIFDDTGADYSQHRAGRAGDFKSDTHTVEEMFELVQKNKKAFLRAGLTAIENIEATPTWLHLDVRPFIEGSMPKDDFLIVNV